MNAKKTLEIQPLGFPWRTKDPFLFCAYHKDEYPKGDEEMKIDLEHLTGRNIGEDFNIKDGFRMYHGTNTPGFPYHPHRGFETITINKQGFVDHSDSLGASGRFGEGDVQWMTAGSGIQHSEMFPLINQDKGNPLEIFQVWLNLPKKSKFVNPHFKMLWKEMIPFVKERDGNAKSTEINVISGQYLNAQSPTPTPDSWASNPDHLVTILTLKMEAGAKWTLPKSDKKATKILYFYKGKTVTIDNYEVHTNHSIEIKTDQNIEIINGSEISYFLFLQGVPINEPVVKYGPFVMNTEEEIRQTMKDFGKTQFGGWPWPEKEKVHPREKGRFALHFNGEEEIK